MFAPDDGAWHRADHFERHGARSALETYSFSMKRIARFIGPNWVKTAKVWSEGNQRDMHYCLAQDLPTLVWAANLADIELHTSLARKKDVTRPTMMVFDLDPGAPADIVQCCQVGLWLAIS